MAHFSPQPLGQLFRPSGQSVTMNAPPDVQTGHAREGSGRSVLSNISIRLAGLRERDRENDRIRQEQRVQQEGGGGRQRLLRDLNHLRDMALGRNAFQGGVGRMGAGFDLEAQNGAPTTGTTTIAATTPLVATNADSRRATSSTRSRREREEQTSLLGPNLANYFGSGSSSSGAVASIPDGLGASLTGSQRRSRLGSRGRARGASLSGLGEGWVDATAALSEENKTNPTSGDTMTMAEGIELDTIKRWIDRSISGGALEITDAEAASSGNIGDSSALCSTLQSYVNLKRNTVKLNLTGEDTTPSVISPHFDTSIRGTHTPAPTHMLQFEYDCASPHISIRIFARASRKHGSWISWTSSREAAGLPTDLSGSEDAESRFYAQRGPPPHVLGWPIYSSRLDRGFGKPVKASIALQLDLYAPPKGEIATQLVDENRQQAPETPNLDASKRLGEDLATPAATTAPHPDPLATAGARLPDSIETKEEKASREKTERETLKITVVVEALDEDGKPLSEPNLQTTYLRLASLPLRSTEQQGSELDVSNLVGGGQNNGPIQDLAMPAEYETREELAGQETPTSTSIATVKRVWSLQIEGQEAEIGPHRFQLQELYGLSSRPPPPQMQEHADHEPTEGDTDPVPVMIDLGLQEEGMTECLICLTNPPTTLLLPCTHGLCLECAVQLRESVKAVRQTERRRGRRPKRKYACPVCRRAYTNMLHLSNADEKKVAQAAAESTS